MADDDKDLVSEVRVEGIDKATEDLKKYGDTGEAAFDKIGDAAQKSGDKVADATGKAEKSVEDLNDTLDITPRTMAKLTGAASSFSTALKSGAGAVTKFSLGVAGIATSGVAAVAGLAKFASSITATVRGVQDSSAAIADNLAIQKKNNQQTLQNVASAESYKNSTNQLNRQVAAGKISFEDYATAIDDLNVSYRESQRSQAILQDAQDEVLKKNKELEAQAKKREAFDSLAETFGTSLTGSLIRLGAAYDVVSKKVVNAFGPIIGSLVDKLTGLIENNAGAIESFIDRTAASLAAFLKENEPAINAFIKAVVTLSGAVGTFVTTFVIPAFTALVGILDKVATAINSVFGTNLSGILLAIIAGVALFTGALTSAFTLITSLTTGVALFVSALSPLGLLVLALAAAFVYLSTSIDWTAFAARAVAAGTTIATFFSNLPANIGALFQGLLEIINAVWDAAVAYVLQVWQSVVDFFSGLITNIGDIFTAIGNAIKNAFNDALNYVIGIFTSWAEKILKFIDPVIQALKQVKSLMSQTAASASADGSVRAAGGGYIRGPGSTTGDKIPAWLSDKEFVVKAKSVAKYGVGFLRALNAGKLDLGAAVRGFSMGGLVTMPSTPRFASGGAVTGQAGRGGPTRSIDLHIGGEVFRGLLAPDDVADKITQFAISRGSVSAGRKPAWVGGRNG